MSIYKLSYILDVRVILPAGLRRLEVSEGWRQQQGWHRETSEVTAVSRQETMMMIWT